MAFLRKRASGNYALSWKWKGKSYIKGLGTKDLAEAEQIKQDAVDQLARIRETSSKQDRALHAGRTQAYRVFGIMHERLQSRVAGSSDRRSDRDVACTTRACDFHSGNAPSSGD